MNIRTKIELYFMACDLGDQRADAQAVALLKEAAEVIETLEDGQ